MRGFTDIKEEASNIRTNVRVGPLIVIDEIQGGDWSSFNMNDVENVSVIKDAPAIYGSSVPYGMIIIATKKRESRQACCYLQNAAYLRVKYLT